MACVVRRRRWRRLGVRARRGRAWRVAADAAWRTPRAGVGGCRGRFGGARSDRCDGAVGPGDVARETFQAGDGAVVDVAGLGFSLCPGDAPRLWRRRTVVPAVLALATRRRAGRHGGCGAGAAGAGRASLQREQPHAGEQARRPRARSEMDGRAAPSSPASASAAEKLNGDAPWTVVLARAAQACDGCRRDGDSADCRSERVVAAQHRVHDRVRGERLLLAAPACP